MKKHHLLLTTLLGAGLLLVSCEHTTVSYRSDESDSTIKVEGNGKLEKSDRAVGAFNKVDVEGVFHVLLSQGNNTSLSVETDANLQDLIISTVENNVLKVRIKDSTNIGKMKKIDLHITVPELAEINSRGVGSLETVGTLKLKQLRFSTAGVGLTRLKLDVEELTIDAEILGAMELSGHATKATINQKGMGAIDAYNLVTERMKLTAEGIGAAQVNVSKELIVDSKGLGAIQYKGHPQVTNIRSEGLGKVEPAED